MSSQAGPVATPPDHVADEAVALIRQRSEVEPRFALVLGSGLGSALGPDALVVDQTFAYGALPGFPQSSIPGHAGKLALGALFGVPAAVFSGRIHFYEGHGMAGATLIPRLAAALGARVLILTNAAGGLDPSMHAGELVVLRDHVNLMGANPLVGWRFGDGTPAFVDLTHVYDDALREAAVAAAQATGVPVRTGVYAAFSGPSYETPAEHAMAHTLGADAVGMSTVPEAVAAAALGMRTVAISCITNVVGSETSHQEVLVAATGAAEGVAKILSGMVPGLGGG